MEGRKKVFLKGSMFFLLKALILFLNCREARFQSGGLNHEDNRGYHRGGGTGGGHHDDRDRSGRVDGGALGGKTRLSSTSSNPGNRDHQSASSGFDRGSQEGLGGNNRW